MELLGGELLIKHAVSGESSVTLEVPNDLAARQAPIQKVEVAS